MLKKLKNKLKVFLKNIFIYNKYKSNYDLLLSKLPNCPFCGNHNLKISRYYDENKAYIVLFCKDCYKYDPKTYATYCGSTYEEAVKRYLSFCEDLSATIKFVDKNNNK